MPTIAPVKMNIEAVDRVTAPIRRIQSTLGTLRSRMSGVLNVTAKLAAAMAGLGVAAAAATTKLFTSFVQRAGEIADASKRIGLSAEALQELRYSAEQAGVSAEVLGTALQRYLLRPGAKVEDITGRIAEAFSQAGDAGAKLRTARELFGRGGAALIPWLEQGAPLIAAQVEEARKLGLVIGNDAVASADELGDRFGTLTKAARGISDAVAASITPDVLRGINDLIAFLAKNREQVVAGLSGFARDLLEGSRELVKAVPDLKTIASDFAEFAKMVGPSVRGLNDVANFLNRTAGKDAPAPWIDVPRLLRRAAEGTQRRVDSVTRLIVSAEGGASVRVAPGSALAPGVMVKESMGPHWGRGHY